jgi:outer membrane protein assembly factor BamB
MKKIHNIMKILTISIITILAISTIILSLPGVAAQEIVATKTTHAFVGAVPNPVGVNQETLLHIGITDFRTLYHEYFEDLTVTVTKPDGTTETLGPYRTDSTGGTGKIYVPDQIGTYTFKTHFPEQTQDYTPSSRIPWDGPVRFLASESEILELVVQAEPVQTYSAHSLPMEYWSRPIDGQLREWSVIAGNWAAAPPGLFAPYNDGPETAHILWARPMAMGGLAGGALGPQSMEDGDAYEGKFQRSIIMNGIFYYHRYTEASRGGLDPQGVYAIDLHTGEELWFKNNTRFNHGQLFYWDAFNYHGVFGYLWEQDGRDWNVYEAFTGEWAYTIEDAPISTGPFGTGYFGSRTMFGANGEIYSYTMDIDEGWMTLWNSSRTVNPCKLGTSSDGSWARNMIRDGFDRVYPAERGIEWNVSIPTDLQGSARVYFYEDRIIGSNAGGGFSLAGRDDPIELWCVSLKPGQEGTVLWRKTWQRPPGQVAVDFAAASQEDEVFVLEVKETRQHYGFDSNTGEQIWGPTEKLPYQGIYGIDQRIVYGKLLAFAKMAGVLHAYDINTGNLVWDFEATDYNGEVLWANDWSMEIVFITDGKLYLGQTEHSVVDPKPRGGPFICLDAETGDVVWRADGMFRQSDWGGTAIIGDSIIVTQDTYDQQIYAIGKGPSKITTNASPKSSTLGRSVLIEGMVTDVSPGTKDPVIQMRFPNGVPAVSDSSMSEWMKYVYKQFEQPMAAGVSVKLEVVMDPNGNYYDIGTTMTDSTGFYKMSWVPPVPGEYLILASFAGSEAYYGSYVETAIVVDESSAPSTPIEPEQPTEPEEPTAPLISTELAITLAVAIIAIIGVAAYWFLKRR